ncbi:hypothetical protein J0383_05150 [Flavobacterium endoglycinae]|uniref:Uncharacterized protein n=1 Tax=Flavobacterium endoglycinae TaxID=2816357 RepID=A0ABX7QIJ7_9FLAO|nr:hypothetical protein [Flavobacterium endoglycinae]QSW90206.1 hypothetical protein J0383_05150 [Flavobacterium endoglycinae]
MNGIIYRITIVCLLFSIFGCKKESIKKESKKSVVNINDLELIKSKDTLRLDYNGDDFGKEIDFGKKENQYKMLLFKNIALDSESLLQFEKLKHDQNLEPEGIKIKKRIKLNANYNTVILSSLESVYTLLNYNSKDELIDFLDLSKFNQQICQCTSHVYINKNGVIHCQIESGKPFYPYVDYKVNDKGKFEIIDQFIPPNEEKMPPKERLEYIIKKTASISGDTNVKSYLESDEFTASNTTFIDEKDVKKILFSKSHSTNVYNLLYDSIEQYTNEEKSLNVLGKVSDQNNLLLVCNLNRADQFGLILILNKNHEVIDSKFINIGDPMTDESILDFVKG